LPLSEAHLQETRRRGKSTWCAAFVLQIEILENSGLPTLLGSISAIFQQDHAGCESKKVSQVFPAFTVLEWERSKAPLISPPNSKQTTSKLMKNKRLFLLPATIAAGFNLLGTNLQGAAIVWDAGGGVNTNWSTASNWNPDDSDVAGDAVTFSATGAAATGVTTNTVDASISIASLTYNQESATLQHTTAIAAGHTLTVAGNFSLGGGVTTTTATNVTLTGGTGTLTVGNSSNSTFQVGQTTPTAGTNTNSLDMSGLGTFNANLGTTAGTFRLGSVSTTQFGALTTVKLAATSNITANALGVGDRAGLGGTHTLKLGSTANTLNVNTISIGPSGSGGRGNGNLSFETSTGTLKLRAADTASAVTTLNLINHSFGTSNNNVATVNLTGHIVDANITTLNMSRRTGTGTSASGFLAQSTLSFDQGTLEVGTAIMGANVNVGLIGKVEAIINIGGGTARFGTINMADNTLGDTTKTITANLNLTGGTTTVTGGIARLGTTNAIATLALSGVSTTLDMSGKNITSLTGITYTSGLLKNLGVVNTGMTLAGSGSRVFDQAAGISGTIQGAITGASLGLTKQGAGNLTLVGTNTYGGATQIDGGILVFRNTSAKAAGAVTAAAAGSIGLGVGAVSGDYTHTDVATLFNTGTLGGPSGFTLDAASSVAVDTTAGNFDQITALTAARGLIKVGTNTLTLSQANTYTGVTTVSAGAINLGVAEVVGVSGPLGTSAAANPGSIVFSGGTLQYSAANSHDYSGRFSTAANQVYRADTNSQNVIWASDLTSSGGTLAKLGAGSLTLSGNNSFTGNVTISTGELKITNANALGTGPKNITAQNATSLTIDGTAGNISLASNLSLQASGLLAIRNNAGDNVINGSVKTVAGNGTATITSDGGSLTLAGNVDSGATGGRILELSGTSTGANTVSGAISNGTATTLAITKSGTGTWILSNNSNINTGATNVNGGKLRIDGTTSTSSIVTANNAGTILGGNGTIGGATTMTTGTIHTAGDAVTLANTTGAGTIDQVDFTTSVTYNQGSIFEWNLTGNTETGIGIRGTNYDAVNTAALATTGTGAIFRVVLNAGQNFGESFWDSDRTWTDIFENTAGVDLNILSIFGGGVEHYNASGAVADVTSVQGSFTFSGTELRWSAVPEPTSALAGLLIGAGLLRRRRSTHPSF
jgi:fibronectin-binding autotransporter adhesin